VFQSNITGQTYTLNTSFVSQADAQKQCACTGGHLVSYTSLDEQQQIEAYYLDKGWLLPTFHRRYWIGLNATTPASTSPATVTAGQLQTSPARFAWLDKSAGMPYGKAYAQWGKAGSFAEPNNLLGSENCGLANASQTYALAWGWSDSSCRISAPFICKTQRELL
jgi:hypothetical protein